MTSFWCCRARQEEEAGERREVGRLHRPHSRGTRPRRDVTELRCVRQPTYITERRYRRPPRFGLAYPVSETPIVIDRGTHIELVIGPEVLGGPSFVGAVSEAITRLGAKPLLVVCEAPAQTIAPLQAYENGLHLSRLMKARVAIVLGGREPTEADRLTDLVAGNRGVAVRSFRDLPAAKAWLHVD